MEKLTTGAAIVEQPTSLAIPKMYIKKRGLKGKDTLHITYKIVVDLLIVEATEYKRENSTPRQIISSGGYCRFNLPKITEVEHGKGHRWECYTDNEGLLRYEHLTH